MRLTRSARVARSFRARSGLRRIRRCMSFARSATAVAGSMTSAVAERVSPRNIASSPNSAPARSSASATMRPSWCSRVSTTAPDAEQVTGVAHVTLAEDDLVAVPVTRHRHVGDRLELARLQVAEHLRAREEPDRFVRGGHEAHNPTSVAVAPEQAVTFADVEHAARALSGRVRETPLLSAGELSRRMGTRVLLKAENLQLTGSFKARGATHMIRGLSPDGARGRGRGRQRRQPRPGGGLRRPRRRRPGGARDARAGAAREGGRGAPVRRRRALRRGRLRRGAGRGTPPG